MFNGRFKKALEIRRVNKHIRPEVPIVPDYMLEDSYQRRYEKEYEAIESFVKDYFNDKVTIQGLSFSLDEKGYTCVTVPYMQDGLKEESTYRVNFSPFSLYDAANHFAAKHRLMKWVWSDFKARKIRAFNEDGELEEYSIDNWTDYIDVLFFKNIETGEVIINKPKPTSERDIKGFIANLVKTNMAMFSLIAEDIATNGPYTFNTLILRKDKPFSKRELNFLIKEIADFGLEATNLNYDTGEITLDFMTETE